MNIGICDDNIDILKILEKTLKNIADEESFFIEVEIYQDPIKFIEDITLGKAKFEMVFLDIDMPELNGIETGRLIRQADDSVLIVYLTGHSCYSLEAFEVRAFHYLIKPVDKEKIRGIFKECLSPKKQRFQKDEKKILTLEFKGGIANILLKDILYIEKRRNQIKVVCREIEHFFYTTLKEMKSKLDEEFVQCHQGFIVNRKYISKIENSTLTVEDKYKIPVSKKHMEKVKACFFDDLLRGKN